MAKDLFWITTTFTILLGILLLAFWPKENSNVIVIKYDCRMLMDGWHPDAPPAVVEECRKRSGK